MFGRGGGLGIGCKAPLREGGHEAVDLAQQAVQFKILEPSAETIAVHCFQRQAGFLRQRNVHQDFGKLAGEVRVVAVVAQLGLECTFDGATTGFRAFCLHLLQRRVDGIQIDVLLQQIDRRLRAHALDAGNVVGAVSGEGLEVHDLVRHHTELGQHTFLTDQRWSA